MTHHDLARELTIARRERSAIPRISSRQTLTETDAYAVQRIVVQHLLLEDEHQLLGIKLGFTNPEKARAAGVERPIAAVLTDRMATGHLGELDTGRLIHPRIEPEAAIRYDAARPGSALVAPAMEVVDSRYLAYDFTAADVIADNASAAHVVIGDDWTEIDLSAPGHDIDDAPVELDVDGVVATAGRTSAILGAPLRALDLALELAREHDLPFEEQLIVMAGAASPAVPLEPGRTYTTTVAGLGSVSVTTS